jgi:hypothetical protein
MLVAGIGKGEKSVDPIIVSTAAPFGIEVVGIVTIVALSLGYLGRRSSRDRGRS